MERENYSKRELDMKFQNIEEKIDKVIVLLEDIAKKEDENTKFRIRTEAVIATFKWLIGLLGIGNVVMLIKMFII